MSSAHCTDGTEPVPPSRGPYFRVSTTQVYISSYELKKVHARAAPGGRRRVIMASAFEATAMEQPEKFRPLPIIAAARNARINPAPELSCYRMTAIAKELDQKLAIWHPDKAAEVERLVADIIHWADADALELMRSRQVEQEVLDLLDEG